MSKEIEKLAKDLVEISIQWKKVKPTASYSYDGLQEVYLMDLMTDQILKTFTNIEDLHDKKAED